MDLNALADAIYTAHFGHLDDKQFRVTKTQEIHDWLAGGTPQYLTLDELIAEWAEYDADEIEANALPAGTSTSEDKE